MAGTTKESIAAENHVAPPVPNGVHGFISKFTVLKDARRELRLRFLIYTAYSITNKTVVLWLSKDLGFSDQAAGARDKNSGGQRQISCLRPLALQEGSR